MDATNLKNIAGESELNVRPERGRIMLERLCPIMTTRGYRDLRPFLGETYGR